MDLSEVVVKAKAGDMRAAGVLVDALRPLVIKNCEKYLGKGEDWEDILQDIFTAFFDKLPGLKITKAGAVVEYLRTISRNLCIQHVKCKKTFIDYDEEEYAKPVQGAVEVESLIHFKGLLHLLEHLPQQMRIIFSLFVFDEYSYEEISRLLGIKVITCRSNVYRAREILQQLIIDHNLKYEE